MVHFESFLKETTFLGISIKTPLLFLIKLIVIYLFVRISTAGVKYLFKRFMEKSKNSYLDATNVGFIQRFVIYILYIIGLTSFLAMVPGMEQISTSVLASAGIMAMAIGLASQEALSNLIGGLFIIFSRPFRVGDFIQVEGGVTGTVAEITLRHTMIRSLENRMVLIPNSKINSSTITNSTIIETKTCSYIEIGVSYTTNLDKAIDVMREEIMKHPLLLDNRTAEERTNNVPQVIIRVIKLGDSSITLKAWAWADSSSNAFIMKCDLFKSIKERFDKENIEIPYPYFNHLVKNKL
ncbi:MAG: mechanosensitive ion channel family protein [Bacteroidaceae bacterium]|nr:mechanosensitive ion channel family protein [Bacteroidaceae bacterium]